MDRTAWIVITLCVVGLVLWEIYISKQMQQARPAMSPAPTAAPLSPTPLVAASPAPFPSPPAAAAAATPAAAAAPFAEKTETLRNADVELRLTNRGGGIAEVVLLNHKAEQNRRVVLNSAERTPIGALID